MASFAFAQDAPLWMRHCAISPDGTTIAFTYKGDIYTVPVNGGHIGYVHIKGTDSPSFRKIYSELLGRNRNKEAVVVDVRHNGGGWRMMMLLRYLAVENTSASFRVGSILAVIRLING